MAKVLRVGNIGFTINAAQLGEVFADCGQIITVRVMADQYSGKSRGFGFVEFGTEEEAAACITKMNGKDYEGRPLAVTDAPNEKTTSRAKRAASAKATAKA